MAMRTSAEDRAAIGGAVDYAVAGMKEQFKLHPDNFPLAAALKYHSIWTKLFIEQNFHSSNSPDSLAQALANGRLPTPSLQVFQPKAEVRIGLLKDGHPIPNPRPDADNPYVTFRQELPYLTTVHLAWFKEEEERIKAVIDLGLHPILTTHLTEANKTTYGSSVLLHSNTPRGNPFDGERQRLSVISWFAGHLSNLEGFPQDPNRDKQVTAELLDPAKARWLRIPCY